LAGRSLFKFSKGGVMLVSLFWPTVALVLMFGFSVLAVFACGVVFKG
jgi:hypothetical protein